MNKRLLLPVAALLCAAPLAAKDADKVRDQEAARLALLRGEILPITRILDLARRAAPGEVIDVELKRRDKDAPARGLKYEVKTLARTGRVREVELDARTGAILKVEDD